MLVDLGVPLTAHQLCWVINETAFRGKFDLAATRRAMAAGQRASGDRRCSSGHSSSTPPGSAGTKSRYEDAFLAIAEPEPLVNMELLGFEVDFHWPEWRLVVEVDGRHTRPKDLHNDPARDRVLRAGGMDRRALHRRTGGVPCLL